MAEITRKSVLLECLSIMREEQRICSKGYNSLEPAKGMEEAWEQGRQKIKILQEIIQALDSEPVLRAMANWQKKEMPPLMNNEDFQIMLDMVKAGKVVFDDNGKLPVRVVKISDDFKDLIEECEKHPFEKLDTEDGTMELR